MSDKKRHTIVLDSDDRESVHQELADLTDEVYENWSGPVKISIRKWDRYNE